MNHQRSQILVPTLGDAAQTLLTPTAMLARHQPEVGRKIPSTLPFGARDYDPIEGRWLQQDPIGLNGGMNLYGYAIANQIMYTDAFGKNADPPDVSGPITGEPNAILCLASKYYQRNKTPEAAFVDAQDSKMLPDPNYSDIELKDAEHYVFADNLTQESSLNAIWLYVATPIYTTAKALGMVPNAGTPSISEIYAGFAGTADGLLNIRPNQKSCGCKQ